MDLDLREWVSLFLRWFHVVAGITWIGQTYLFNWFEKNLAKEEVSSEDNIAGRLWMVHGGGFYRVEKQRVPQLMPQVLHWFRWESALTWISGILLLGIVYYWGGLLVEYDSEQSESVAIFVGIGTLIFGWILYDYLWRSPLGRNEKLGATLSFAVLVATTYGLTHFLSSRAAYMHVGAMFGTIMVANVWFRILPGQQQMLAAIKNGREPDLRKGLYGKQCSKHNTYMSVPIIFIMISNHFPTISYGHEYNWVVLSTLILLGFGAARLLRGSF